MPWPDTRLTELFGIELPIIAAPMANFAGVELAVAVAEAGGLGSLPCAALSPDQIRAGVAEFRSRSKKPLNLNLFCHEEPEEDGARDAAWLSRISPYYVELGVEVPALPLKGGHPPFGEAEVHLIGNHPVREGLDDFTVHDERYADLHLTDVIEPIGEHVEEGVRHPLIWGRELGRSRLVYDALGHDTRSYESVGHRALIAQALAWLARVPAPTAADFGGVGMPAGRAG